MIGRAVSQRTGILAGQADAETAGIAEIVKQAYNRRSEYAHGSQVKPFATIQELSEVTRRTLLAALILSEDTQDAITDIADRALLSTELKTELRGRVRDFSSRTAAQI